MYASLILQLWLQVAVIPFIWTQFLQAAAHREPFYAAFQDELAFCTPTTPSNLSLLEQPQQQHVPEDSTVSLPALTERVGAEVARAVRAVHGQDLGWEVPLVQAGLDSLGALSQPETPIQKQLWRLH